MKRLAFCLVVLATAASAQTAAPVNCADFQRMPNGAWQVVRDVRITNPNGGPAIRLSAGNVVTPHGLVFAGTDIGAVVETLCGK